MTGFVQSVITIVLFILILGVLVVIHELGHFVTARLANVRVLEFGIGFPPRAKVLRAKGETLYSLNWLPLGGFVKLEGEDGDAANDPRAFSSKSLPVRLWILVAGVLMNVLLAFVIFTGLALYGDPTIGVPGRHRAARLAGRGGRRPVRGRARLGQRRVLRRLRRRGRSIDGLASHAGETVTVGIERPGVGEVTVHGDAAHARGGRRQEGRDRGQRPQGRDDRPSHPATRWSKRSRSGPSGRSTRSGSSWAASGRWSIRSPRTRPARRRSRARSASPPRSATCSGSSGRCSRCTSRACCPPTSPSSTSCRSRRSTAGGC